MTYTSEFMDLFSKFMELFINAQRFMIQYIYIIFVKRKYHNNRSK